MKLLPLSLICLYSLTSTAQDTIFYNEKWKITTKDQAKYYGINTQMHTDSLINMENFYMSGKIQMKGKHISLKPNVRQGLFEWFYENGQKFSSCYYQNNSINGLF